MNIRDAILQAKRDLTFSGVPDAAQDAKRLLAFVLRMDPLTVSLFSARPLSEEDRKAFFALVQQRADRIPLQYLEGEASFMGLSFEVNPDVLIPRPDTETLCEAALRLAVPSASVLEIGTGSGALSVAMKHERPDLLITAVEKSERALRVAQRNAMRNGVFIDFLKGDCYSPVTGRRFHLILSNPPYISKKEMETLDPEVKKEPHLALYGGSDGLAMHRRLICGARRHLFAGGWVALEIGWRQKDAVCELMRREVGIPFAKRDDGRNWRVVGAQWGRSGEYES